MSPEQLILSTSDNLCKQNKHLNQSVFSNTNAFILFSVCFLKIFGATYIIGCLYETDNFQGVWFYNFAEQMKEKLALCCFPCVLT